MADISARTYLRQAQVHSHNILNPGLTFTEGSIFLLKRNFH